MSELVNKVAEILNAPVDLVQRSAEARAAASGVSVDDVLSSWAGGESVAASAPKEETPVVEEAPVEEVVQEIIEETAAEEVVEEVIEETAAEEVVEEVIEEIVEMKNESSLSFISGVLLVSIFTYLFAFAIPKNQATNLVSDSLNNSVNATSEVIVVIRCRPSTILAR